MAYPSRDEIANPRKVGFWSGGWPDDPTLPRATDLVDESWGGEERAQVLAHLAKGTVAASYRGFSVCRICKQRVGSQDHWDGTWLWPSGFSHYVEVHQVKPPQEFIDHVLS